MLHNARETMLVITVTGWRQDRSGSRIILLSSSFNLLSIIKKSVYVPENLNWHSQRTYALLTLFYNHHHHHHIAAWVPFISRFESATRTLTLRKTKMDEVNSLKKNSHTAPFLKLLHFNVSLQWISLHAIFGKKTLLFWSDIITFSLVFLSNDLMTVRFDDIVTVIKHPLETRKKRMVFNELLLLTWIICSPLPLKN